MRRPNTTSAFAITDGEGVAKDAAEAVKWYRKAAEQGFAAAQYNLGVCYYSGEGVAKDAAEAVKWFRKAAEQGFAECPIQPRRLLLQGRGRGQGRQPKRRSGFARRLNRAMRRPNSTSAIAMNR